MFYPTPGTCAWGGVWSPQGSEGPFPGALPAAPLKFVPGPEWKNFGTFAGWGLNRQKPTDTTDGGEKLSPQLQELLTALWRYL